MAMLTVRNLAGRSGQAGRAGALGDAFAALGREIGLTNDDWDMFEQARDKVPVEPPRFE